MQLELSYTVGGHAKLLEKDGYFLIKLNIYLSYNPAIFLGMFSRGMKKQMSPKDFYINIHNTFIHIGLRLESIWVFINRITVKQAVVYSCNEYLSLLRLL